jgi:hypothetical protein
MMKRFGITIIFLIMCVCAHAQTAEQTVLDLSKKKFGWMIRQRFDSLQAVLDERLVFVHSNGWTEKGTEFVDDIKSGKLKYVNIEVQESSARVYETTAIVLGKGKFTVVLEGKPLDINLYYTEVYIRKNGKWLLASRHANRLP